MKYLNKIELYEAAKVLKKVSTEAIKDFDAHKEELLYKMNKAMEEREDIYELVGEKNIKLMKENHANHLQFMHSILETPNPEILVDTVLWVFRRYISRGFQVSYWPVQLSTWCSIMKCNLLPQTMKEIEPIYQWLILHILHFAMMEDENVEMIQQGMS